MGFGGLCFGCIPSPPMPDVYIFKYLLPLATSLLNLGRHETCRNTDQEFYFCQVTLMVDFTSFSGGFTCKKRERKGDEGVGKQKKDTSFESWVWGNWSLLLWFRDRNRKRKEKGRERGRKIGQREAQLPGSRPSGPALFQLPCSFTL